MPTAKAQLMRRVREYMVRWERRVGLDNELGLTDINKEAEDFYCGLLRIVLDAKLKNLNLLKMDFPAIDLADGEKRVCVQVTSTEGREKIVHTLDRFFAHNLQKDYDWLIILIIGRKKRYRDGLPVRDGFNFDPEQDIWDTARLILEIQDLEMDRLRRVDAYLEEQLGPLTEQPAPLDLPLRTAMNEDNFVGRESELAEIAKRFETDRIVVLSGLGGMGKTELAVRYGQEYTRSGRGQVYFVHFRKDFFHTVTDEIAPVIPGLTEQGLDENGKYQEAMKVLQSLDSGDILILDNADWANFSALRRALNGLPMKVLVTTRMDVAKAVSVAALHREALYAIFWQQEVDILQEEMDALIEAVEGHTLTVDLMARTMRRGRRAATAEKLLTALKEHDLAKGFSKVEIDYAGSPEQARINEHLKAVFRVAELGADVQELLRCATLLPTKGMDDELFLASFVEEAEDWLDDLIEGGWLYMENGLLRIHPVIRIVCIEVLKPTGENCNSFLHKLWNTFDKEKFLQLLKSKPVSTEYRQFFQRKKSMGSISDHGTANAQLPGNAKFIILQFEENYKSDKERVLETYRDRYQSYLKSLMQDCPRRDYEEERTEYSDERLISHEEIQNVIVRLDYRRKYYDILESQLKLGESTKYHLYMHELENQRQGVERMRMYCELLSEHNKGQNSSGIRPLRSKKVGSIYRDADTSLNAQHHYFVLLSKQMGKRDEGERERLENKIAMHQQDFSVEKIYEAIDLGWGSIEPMHMHPYMVQLLFRIAIRFAEKDKFAEAAEIARKAFSVIEKTLPENDPDVLDYQHCVQMLEMLAMCQVMGVDFPNPFKH